MFSKQCPKVSVVMSVFNGEPYLGAAVDSILAQTFANLEFIIINDGSTDGSAAILEEYETLDPRIQVFHQENQGLIASLNKGIDLARGKYIARMDADDISLPQRLARQVEVMEAHPEIGVLGTGVTYIDGKGNTSQILQFPTQHNVLRWCLCFVNPILHPTVMIRREIVEQAGGYCADMLHAEDYDLWRRLSNMTRLSNLHEVLLHLRKHDVNVSIRHASEQWRNSVKTSCLMISDLLSEEIPASKVQCLWTKELQDASDVRKAAELVCRLHSAFSSDTELSPAEKLLIRRDAARRLYGLGHPWIPNVNAWRVLACACFLDPFPALRVVREQFFRVSKI